MSGHTALRNLTSAYDLKRTRGLAQYRKRPPTTTYGDAARVYARRISALAGHPDVLHDVTLIPIRPNFASFNAHGRRRYDVDWRWLIGRRVIIRARRHGRTENGGGGKSADACGDRGTVAGISRA